MNKRLVKTAVLAAASAFASLSFAASASALTTPTIPATKITSAATGKNGQKLASVTFSLKARTKAYVPFTVSRNGLLVYRVRSKAADIFGGLGSAPKFGGSDKVALGSAAPSDATLYYGTKQKNGTVKLSPCSPGSYLSGRRGYSVSKGTKYYLKVDSTAPKSVYVSDARVTVSVGFVAVGSDSRNNAETLPAKTKFVRAAARGGGDYVATGLATFKISAPKAGRIVVYAYGAQSVGVFDSSLNNLAGGPVKGKLKLNYRIKLPTGKFAISSVSYGSGSSASFACRLPKKGTYYLQAYGNPGDAFCVGYSYG